MWNQFSSEYVKHNSASLLSQNLLRCVAAVTKHKGTSHANTLIATVLPGVMFHCSDIWRCIYAVHARVVNDTTLDYSIRLQTGRTNLTVLSLFTNFPTALPGVIPILLQMAHLEMTAGSVDLSENQDVILKLNEHLPSSLAKSQFSWDRDVLRTPDGDAGDIARVALWHLNSRRSHLMNGWPAEYRASAVANCLLYIEEISRNPSIREGLVFHNSIPTLVAVLKTLSDRPPPKPELFGTIIDTICKPLMSQIFGSVDLERKIAAQEAGIIPALMRCSLYFTAGEKTVYSEKNAWYKFLFHILPSSMIYPSIHRTSRLDIRKVKAQSLPPKVKQLYTQILGMLDDISTIKPVKSKHQLCAKVCHFFFFRGH